jgi:hypothetical protein
MARFSGSGELDSMRTTYWFFAVMVILLGWFSGWMPAGDNHQGSQPGSESAPAEKADKKAPAPSPAEEPPLLLEEEEEKPSERMADNSRCLVCHLNYKKEKIAYLHAKAGIGCVKCHGASDAHIADESWASGGNGTPPDIMYPPQKVVPSCLSCHELRKTDPDCRCEFPRLEKQKSCTDCHGNHRLKNRKCKWK